MPYGLISEKKRWVFLEILFQKKKWHGDKFGVECVSKDEVS